MLINRTYKTYNRDYNPIYISRSSSIFEDSAISSSSTSESSITDSSSSSFIENNPYIVQSKNYQTQGPLVTSIAFSLTNTPSVDNILIAFLAVNNYLQSRTPTIPDSSWNLIHTTLYSNSRLYAYWKKVNTGDGKNYTFNISGTAEYHSGIIYEIAGSDTENPIDQSSLVTRASGTTAATNSVIPSIKYTLPLATVITVVGQTNGTTLNSISSGWSNGPTGYSTWLSTWGAYKSLTQDTVTSISNTFTFNINTLGAIASIILVAPKEFMSSSSSS